MKATILSTHRRVVEDKARRRVDGDSSGVRCGVRNLASVKLEGLEFGFPVGQDVGYEYGMFNEILTCKTWLQPSAFAREKGGEQWVMSRDVKLIALGLIRTSQPSRRTVELAIACSVG
jgi:hypothetical protein